MSLVNDMLRDLNKRTPVSSGAARIHGAINSSIESKRPKVRVGTILAGGLLAGLGAGYFYFESMGVQMVQVPLAPIPKQSATADPGVLPQVMTPAEVVTAATEIAPAGQDTPAIETIADIRELALQPNGFTLLIAVSQRASFEIRDRSAYGLTVHLDGVDKFERAATTVPGMSLLLVSDGLDIGIELDDAADFLVGEDTETDEFDILLTASYRSPEISATEPPQVGQPPDMIEQPVAPPAVLNEAAALPQPSAPSAERSTPGRVNRELSLESRDRNNSQQAVAMVQGGRMYEAYEQLLKFIGDNPAAHVSRETLATLLLAQNEFGQALTIVDDGLAIVPNFAPFKKIKARLLMRDGKAAEALELLRAVPPAVTDDAEYHELLASLYQDGSLHEQATATYKELLRTNAEQGRWWAGLGISLEAQNKGSEALSSFQAALQTQTLDARLRQYVQNRVVSLSQPQ